MCECRLLRPRFPAAVITRTRCVLAELMVLVNPLVLRAQRG